MRATKLLPVTVEFDGCFCSEACPHLFDKGGYQDCELGHGDVGRPLVVVEGLKIDHKLKGIQHQMTCVRTRWCCETFGMGEHATEKHEDMGDYELETMDAKDAEALRVDDHYQEQEVSE